MNNASPIKVLVVEDQGLFRDMLHRSLSSQPGIKVVGAVGDGQAAIGEARKLKPDVVMMDIELGNGPNGIEAAHIIKGENPSVGIVILSMHGEKEYVSSIPLGSASGWSYLLKSSVHDLSALTRAIEGTAMGLVVMDPAIVNALKPRRRSRLDELTPRELEVMKLIAQGYSNSGIAGKLVLSEKSVERHINSIYQKFQLNLESNIYPRVKAVVEYIHSTE